MVDITCLQFLITGTVQGVGFRPFVYHLAQKHGLRGQILNTSMGVLIEVEGLPAVLDSFARELRCNPPHLARIDQVLVETLPYRGYKEFTIRHSRVETQHEALPPPDAAICADCRREVLDPGDRHYHYPFTNCTNCGPRFTVLENTPYDRALTTMRDFPLCAACTQEYRDPVNRRFHAQPIACPSCGPQVELVDRSGHRVAGQKDWLEITWRLWQEGAIVAVKGLGGFHLACDAANAAAVRKLRQRKGRACKPLAVMARDVAAVRRCCKLDAAEEELLASPSAPIVILQSLPESPLPDGLAPNLKTLGVMLPYTPLHVLLLNGPLDLLVMTSGNKSGMPLVKDNEQALTELGDMVDFFLWHDRPIANRCDDSVIEVVNSRPRFLRRSRGYVPQGIGVQRFSSRVVLGMGGEMKNAFCLLRQGEAYLSQYLGTMEHLEGEGFFQESLAHWQRLLDVRPDIVAYDLHPGYASSNLARSLPGLLQVGVQHHHAHLASCLAENRETGPAIGLILDGSGYGLDERLWGFEILSGDFNSFSRHCHLRYLPLPGGELAVQQPWRVALSYLLDTLGNEGLEAAYRLWEASKGKELEIAYAQIRHGLNSPLACGCGRLFDAVAVLLGLGEASSYEGQLAIELGELVSTAETRQPLEPYPFDILDQEIDSRPLLAALWEDYQKGTNKAMVARRFHDTLVTILIEATQKAAGQTGLDRVALSGGCWYNRYLFLRTKEELQRAGFKVLSHSLAPPDDGGLALGQALIADRRWREACA